MIHDAKITFVVGRRNSGKTTKLYQLMKGNRRCILFAPIKSDFLEGFDQAHSLKEVLKIIKRNWRSKKGIRIAFRPGEGREVEQLHHLSVLLRRIQEPYSRDLDSRQITLVVDELNLGFPHNRPTGMDGFKFAVLQGRHYGINIIGAAQRPTLVDPNFRDNQETLYIFPLGAENAIKSICDFVGYEHKPAIRALANHQFLKYQDAAFTRGKNPPLKQKKSV